MSSVDAEHASLPCSSLIVPPFFLGSLKDDDLASRLGLQSKELNKIVAVLSNDKLVKVYVQVALCHV